MHRMTIQYGQPSDAEAFDARYQGEHVALAQALPGLRRFTTSHPRALRGEAPYFVAELWFDDAASMKAAMKSPEMAATAAHAEGFDASMSIFTGEVVEAV